MRIAAVLSGLVGLLGSLPLAPAAAAKAPLAWPSGSFGNVHTIAETGDMLGMEARFFQRGAQHFVEFVWCEGWCNDVNVMPVSRGDNGFMFHYSQRFEGGGAQEIHFVAWPAGRGIKIGAWQGREPIDDGKPQRLRRLARPFAIPFAKVNGAR